MAQQSAALVSQEISPPPPAAAPSLPASASAAGMTPADVPFVTDYKALIDSFVEPFVKASTTLGGVVADQARRRTHQHFP